MNKRYFFISGLPRSGSSLLSALLNQHPDIHATATSGLLSTLLGLRNTWEERDEHRALTASLSQVRKLSAMRGLAAHYHDDVDKPVILDKCRGWTAHIELAEAVFGGQIKILCPVRDPRDILASFEKIWRRNAATWQIPQEKNNPVKFATLAGRCEVWSAADQPLGLAYNNLKDAAQRGYGDCLHFVSYEALTTHPYETLMSVYHFLGLPAFDHDLESIEVVETEDDRAHGIPHLHDVAETVTTQAPQWPDILGEELGKLYGGTDFWN